MNHRFLTLLVVTALCIGLALSSAGQAQKAPVAPATKPATEAKPWTAKTPDGQPDLQGYWTYNSYTTLERPNDVTKEFYTLQKITEAEKKPAARDEEQTTPATVADVHYDLTQFGLDRS